MDGAIFEWMVRTRRPPVVQVPGAHQTPSLFLMRRPGFEAISRMRSGTWRKPIEVGVHVDMMVYMMIMGWCLCRQDDDGLVSM